MFAGMLSILNLSVNRVQRQQMSLALEGWLSREANTLLTGTATGVTHAEGGPLVEENTQRTTQVMEKASLATECVTKETETGEKAPLRENRSHSSADPLTPADDATHHTLYVDIMVVDPRTPMHHAEKWLWYAVTRLLSRSRQPVVPWQSRHLLFSQHAPW